MGASYGGFGRAGAGFSDADLMWRGLSGADGGASFGLAALRGGYLRARSFNSGTSRIGGGNCGVELLLRDLVFGNELLHALQIAGRFVVVCLRLRQLRLSCLRLLCSRCHTG